MERPRRRIQHKLVAAFIAMGLIPSVLSAVIVVRGIGRLVERDIEAQIERASALLSARLEEALGESERAAVRLLADERIFPEVFALKDAAKLPGDLPEPLLALWVLGRTVELDYGEWPDGVTLHRTVLSVLVPGQTETALAGTVAPVSYEGKAGSLIVGLQLSGVFAQSIEDETGVNVRLYQVRAHGAETDPQYVEVAGLSLTGEQKEQLFKEGRELFLRRAVLHGQGYTLKVLPIRSERGNVIALALLGIPERHNFEEVVRAEPFFPLLFAMVLFLAAAIGYPLARGVSKPVRNVARSARAVAAGDLNQHLDVRSRDEVGDLAEAFNQMLEKLREMRAMEEELHRKERLASLGEMAAAVAHEIRNPLGILRSSAQRLGRRVSTLEEKELAGFVVAEVDRLDKVVEDLLQFARPREPRFERRSLRELLERAVKLAGPGLARNGVSCEVRCPEEVVVEADGEQLVQALLNLILNAADAAGEAARAGTAGEGKVTVEGRRLPDAVEIAVSDNGPGVPEEVAPRVFDPFFSTKADGTGLGLSIVQKIVEDVHGGQVRLERAGGPGATFLVRLGRRT